MNLNSRKDILILLGWVLASLLIAFSAGAYDQWPEHRGDMRAVNPPVAPTALTPWTETIDADGYALTDLGDFTMRAPGDIWSSDGSAITWHPNLAMVGQVYGSSFYTVTPTGTTATVNWDLAQNNKAILDLSATSGNVTGITFSNLRNATYVLKVRQHATPRTVAGFPAAHWPNGVPWIITAVASAEDVLTCDYDGADLDCYVSGQGMATP